ncbi:MAG: hypothetical protein KGL39_07535 [Patescibacteria group bacterium]|nr:hypothetical protein [Patescibacteria group bacterium]
MKRKDNLGTNLDKLALKMIDDVSGDPRQMGEEGIEPAVTPGYRLEVFKAVSQYYIGVIKAKNKVTSDDDDSGSNFSDIRKRLHAVNGGKQ